MQGGRGGAVGARQLPGRRGQEGGRVLCEHRPGGVDGWGGAGRRRRHDHLPEALSGGHPRRA